MSLLRPLLWVLLLAQVACVEEATTLYVRLEPTAPFVLSQLVLSLAFGEQPPRPGHELLQDGHAPVLPAQVIARVPDEANDVSVLVNATAASGDPIFASSTVRAVPHARVEVVVTLPAPSGDRLALGSPCGDAAACASGFCVEGVCCDRACDGGPCEACSAAAGAAVDGNCTLLTVECRPSAGPCDVAEVCDGKAAACPLDVLQPANTTCRPLSGSCDLAESCDGKSPDCPPDASSCPGTQYCNGASCVARRGLGEVCAASKECLSGFCVDGVCCDTACAGACDSCASVVVGAPKGTCTLLPATTVCRAAAGPCDAVERCDGTSATCPADLKRPAGTICRPAGNDPCDSAERCNGTGNTCPADTIAPQLSASYATSVGRDGFTKPNSVGYQRVEGACYADGSETHGHLSFATAGLPDNALVLSATLTGCNDAGPGAQRLGLFRASFALPLSSAAFASASGPRLVDMPNASGTQTFSVPTSSISTTGETQYTMIWPEVDCSTFHGKRWAGSQSNNLADCADRTPWVLGLTYCTP